MEHGYGGLTAVSGWEPPIVNHGSGLQPVASALVPGGIIICVTWGLCWTGDTAGLWRIPETGGLWRYLKPETGGLWQNLQPFET